MIKLNENKQFTENKPIEKLPTPKFVHIPLIQHIGKPCENLEVKLKDEVSVGQRLSSASVQIFAPVHSSVSGRVIAIEDWPHPVLGKTKAITIEVKDNNIPEFKTKSIDDVKKLTPEEIRNIIFEAGIVGMGGASFPTYIKLNPPNKINNLIINGAECEPYLTADYRLMLEKTEEILLGIKVVAKCLGVENIYIAIEDNKPEAINKFSNALKASGCELRAKVKVLKSMYPQGGEKQLVRSILNREIPRGKLPFDIGVVVQNVATVFAIYEAVFLGKPLYERVVSVIGSSLANSKNILAPIGATAKDLIDFCGPLKEEPAKVIFGGPMMGIAQFSFDTPVIKSTNGILLLNKNEIDAPKDDFCIRCGACVRQCPAGLMQCLINLASEKKMWKEELFYGAGDCIECGVCSYVCPSNRNLVQSIKRAKLEIK